MRHTYESVEEFAEGYAPFFVEDQLVVRAFTLINDDDVISQVVDFLDSLDVPFTFEEYTPKDATVVIVCGSCEADQRDVNRYDEIVVEMLTEFADNYSRFFNRRLSSVMAGYSDMECFEIQPGLYQGIKNYLRGYGDNHYWLAVTVPVNKEKSDVTKYYLISAIKNSNKKVHNYIEIYYQKIRDDMAPNTSFNIKHL